MRCVRPSRRGLRTTGSWVAEKVLLQETLVGCIKALIDVLAITNPVAFGRTNRVKRLAMEISAAVGAQRFWQLEAAAMLSQIGYISLPVELVEKLFYGERLTSDERTLADGAPKVAQSLLGHIPRLEPVMQILEGSKQPQLSQAQAPVDLGVNILHLVLDYDALIAQGSRPTRRLRTSAASPICTTRRWSRRWQPWSVLRAVRRKSAKWRSAG